MGTDECYFSGSSTVGSTLTVWGKAAGWAAVRGRTMTMELGASVGVERLSEATGLGSLYLAVWQRRGARALGALFTDERERFIDDTIGKVHAFAPQRVENRPREGDSPALFGKEQ